MTLLPMGSVTKFRCLGTNRGVTNLLSSTSPIPARADIVVLGQPLVEVSLTGGSHNDPVVLGQQAASREGRDTKLHKMNTTWQEQEGCLLGLPWDWQDHPRRLLGEGREWRRRGRRNVESIIILLSVS